jgi:hypothetical protein
MSDRCPACGLTYRLLADEGPRARTAAPPPEPPFEPPLDFFDDLEP